MIFNIYNFKLYSPNGDAEYSGGGAEGGRGEGESPAREPGGGTTSGGGGGGSTNGQTNYDREIYDTTSTQAGYKIAYPSSSAITKSILQFTTNKKNNFKLEAKGEKREIIIVGTPGAIFTLTIKDSSNCSILRDKLENVKIPVKGRYTFIQDFPAITSEGRAVKTEEVYTLEIKPAADVAIATEKTFTLKQIADPVITITNTTSQTSPALSVSGSDITLTGGANSGRSNISKTYTLTVTENPEDSAGKLYYTGDVFNNNISSNTTIKKLINRDGETGFTKTLFLNNTTTRTTSTIENSEGARIRNADGSFTENTNTTSDLIPGMSMFAEIVKNKTVVGNLNEDNEIIDYDTCKTLPTRLKLSDTNDLFVGMVISGEILQNTYIESIDCDKNITIAPRQVVRPNSTIRFTKKYNGTVSFFENTSRNKSKVILSKPVDIPDGTEIEFDDSKNRIFAVSRVTGSGTDTVTLTNFIRPIRFGSRNATLTLDLDKLVTSKPNAYNIKTTTKRNTAVVINMIQHDRDANASSKTGTIVENPKNGTVATTIQVAGASSTASTDSLAYTPANGFTGEDSFTFTMSDGTNSSDEKTVIIKVI